MSDAHHSRPVQSKQRFVHPRLGERVRKHLSHPHRRPAADHTLAAFEKLLSWKGNRSESLVFDSYCGTGASTRLLAERHPNLLVVGIDKSAHRLARHGESARDNYLLVQADCGDLWRLALEEGWRLEHHYLFYPNPWPKPAQLGRRVQGSADFSALLDLGGKVELRSNWQLYTEEFGVALAIAGQPALVDEVRPDLPVSLFERKYSQSGHRLWRCRCQLSDNRAIAPVRR